MNTWGPLDKCDLLGQPANERFRLCVVEYDIRRRIVY